LILKSYILCILPLLIYQLFVSLFLNLRFELQSYQYSTEDSLWINAWQFAAMIPNQVVIEPYRLILAPLYHYTISHLISNLLPLGLLFYLISTYFDANDRAIHWRKMYVVIYGGGILSCFGSFIASLIFDLDDWRAGISGGLFACCAYLLWLSSDLLSSRLRLVSSRLRLVSILLWLILLIWAIAPFSSMPIDRLSHLFGILIGVILGVDQRIGAGQRKLKILGNTKLLLIGLIGLQITALGYLGRLLAQDAQRWHKVDWFQTSLRVEGSCKNFKMNDKGLISIWHNGLIGFCFVVGADWEDGKDGEYRQDIERYIVKDLSGDQKGEFLYLLLRDDEEGVWGVVVSRIKLSEEMVLGLILRP
jgi:membrane associated rhomboid family serine protease